MTLVRPASTQAEIDLLMHALFWVQSGSSREQACRGGSNVGKRTRTHRTSNRAAATAATNKRTEIRAAGLGPARERFSSGQSIYHFQFSSEVKNASSLFRVPYKYLLLCALNRFNGGYPVDRIGWQLFQVC